MLPLSQGQSSPATPLSVLVKRAHIGRAPSSFSGRQSEATSSFVEDFGPEVELKEARMKSKRLDSLAKCCLFLLLIVEFFPATPQKALSV